MEMVPEDEEAEYGRDLDDLWKWCPRTGRNNNMVGINISRIFEISIFTKKRKKNS
jgi:hypothetical protein